MKITIENNRTILIDRAVPEELTKSSAAKESLKCREFETVSVPRVEKDPKDVEDKIESTQTPKGFQVSKGPRMISGMIVGSNRSRQK